ncbi:MBL fold metallo-hydrolase [Phenylobacterium sp.]|jgi:L-ascorbate metabolism protein UlaG (beta-lactamase superfamily)|uniref:MBL fold metallo-hydrolase n=1 Tax=Phenylobacterium sp. TaxID=1871053 RepID=UPI002F9370AF
MWKSLSRVLAALLAVSAPAARAVEPTRVDILWLGGPTMLIRFGPISILTDPVLGEGQAAFRMFDPNTGRPDGVHARVRPMPKAPRLSPDLVLLSHDHEDHLDETARGRLAGVAPFTAPASQVAGLQSKGVRRASALRWGETQILTREGYEVSITAAPARHSTDPAAAQALGEVNGYLITFRRGPFQRSLYWTGDSFPPDRRELLPDLLWPDLFVPHLGGVGEGGPFGRVSMAAEDALAFARLVRPTAVLPIHHSTFSLYREPVEVFLRASAQEPWRTEQLSEGDVLTLR